jgi:2-polyprenyl-3-methyl-5-hydroxy-6-metoxy-1,4-benzoquinol methylase
MAPSMTHPGSSKAARDDWDGHWSEKAVTNALNPAQAYRRDMILRLLALGSAPSPVRVLDFGCGSGELARHVLGERTDAEILGIDGSSTAIDIARRNVPKGHFVQRDLSDSRPLEGFCPWATHAVCTEVLEHLDDPRAALANLRPFLLAGSKLVITVPAGPMSAFDRHLGHRRHFTPRTLRATLEAAGLEVTHLRGAGFPFFNLYRLAIVLRGKGVIRDSAARDRAEMPRMTRAAIRVFDTLLRWSNDDTLLGWQLVAVARAR